ncbi:MAG: TonB-dependent receptor [Bacteroidota bacterium]
MRRVKNILLPFFLFAFLILSTLNIFSQNLEKKISLNEKNVSLGEVIQKIGIAGGIDFSYSTQQIPITKKVSIKAKNKSLKEILTQLGNENGFEFVVVEKQVVLKPRKQSGNPEVVEKPKEITTHILSGYVKDKSSGEVLIGAAVYVKGTQYGIFTNSFGFYSLRIPEGNISVSFSMIGYQQTETSINLISDQSISFEAEPIKLEIQTVEIIAGSSEPEAAALHPDRMKLLPSTLERMPAFAGEVDVIKSLQSVPGVKSYGDGSALFYVRGGNSDQNLILVDDAPIYNPAHLFGFFTALAPDAIKDVEVYKGDVPAKYGGRLSSVIDIRMKDGNMKEFGMGGNIGLFTSGLTFEGPFKKDRCSFFLSTRNSKLNWLNTGRTDDSKFNIAFNDFNLKLNYKANDQHRFFLTIYGGRDDVVRKPFAEAERFGIWWGNLLGTFRWNYVIENNLFTNTTLYSSSYNYTLYLDKAEGNYWSSSINNTCIKTDITYYPNSSNLVTCGIELGSHRFNPGNVTLSDEYQQQYVPEISKYNSGEIVFYLANEYKANKRLVVDYGLRLPLWSDYGPSTTYVFDQNYFVSDTILSSDRSDRYKSYLRPEPRLALRYSTSKNNSFKLSYNRTVQFIQVLSNSAGPFTSMEVWVPCGPNIHPQTADQISAGFFHAFEKKKIMLTAEVFYKHLGNQIDYEDHANLLLNPLLEGELRFGKGKAYGTEVMLRKTEGKLTGWIAYTYCQTLRTIKDVNQNIEFPAAFDRPHDVNIYLSLKAGKRWTFASTWILQSGSPISTPVSFFTYDGYTVPVFGEKNNDRLPVYHRLDFSITFKLNKKENNYRHSLLLNIYNVYGRKNPFCINFNKMINDNGQFVIPSDLNGNYTQVASSLSVSGMVPSISYIFKFR